MKSEFSKTWKSSVKPRKQRKYRYKAPFHIKSKFMNVNLSKELREKHGTRNLRLKVGDKVKILRGNFKGKEGAVVEIDLKNTKVYVNKIEVTKMEGTKVRRPLNPTNLQIIDLKLDDKKRKDKLAKFKSEAKPSKTSQTSKPEAK